MIKEPESRFDGLNFYHYSVEHDGKFHQCNTLAYASYLAEKFDAKIWSVVLQKHIEPHIGLCGYCEKYSKLHFVDEVLVIRLANNTRYVYASKDGERISVEVPMWMSPRLPGKTIKVVKNPDSEHYSLAPADGN